MKQHYNECLNHKLTTDFAYSFQNINTKGTNMIHSSRSKVNERLEHKHLASSEHWILLLSKCQPFWHLLNNDIIIIMKKILRKLWSWKAINQLLLLFFSIFRNVRQSTTLPISCHLSRAMRYLTTQNEFEIFCM